MTKYIQIQTLKDYVGEDPEMIERILTIYKEDLENLNEKIEGLIEGEKIEEIQRIAHTLKSSSAYLGLDEMKDIFRNIEEADRKKDGSRERIGKELEKMNQLSEVILLELEHLISDCE